MDMSQEATHHEDTPVAVPVDAPELEVCLGLHGRCPGGAVNERQLPKAAPFADAGHPLSVHIHLQGTQRERSERSWGGVWGHCGPSHPESPLCTHQSGPGKKGYAAAAPRLTSPWAQLPVPCPGLSWVSVGRAACLTHNAVQSCRCTGRPVASASPLSTHHETGLDGRRMYGPGLPSMQKPCPLPWPASGPHQPWRDLWPISPATHGDSDSVLPWTTGSGLGSAPIHTHAHGASLPGAVVPGSQGLGSAGTLPGRR